MAALADPNDVAAGWRPLTSDELTRVGALLDRASRMVRALVPTVDARIASGMLDPELVADVVCNMVRRVLATPTDQLRATTQEQTTAGPFSQSVSYSTSDAGMYLSKSDRTLLGVGAQRARTIDMFTVAP